MKFLDLKNNKGFTHILKPFSVSSRSERGFTRTPKVSGVSWQSQRGFTLAELNIVIAIVAFISAVVLFGYRQFTDRLALSSAAQEIAIAIREAQSYGVSVKESGSQSFENAYGIYFSVDDPTNYYIFVDLDDSQKYEHTGDCIGECVSKNTIRGGVYVSQTCGAPFSGSLVCPVNPSVRGINASFIRPDPDARIRFINSGNEFFGNLYMTGRIILTSPLGNTMNVNIENTGQISIN